MTQLASPWPTALPDCVAVERRNNIAVVTLNRAAKRNALNDELVLGLQTFFTTIPRDIQGVVMCGAGESFCAGLDLNELKEADTAESFETALIGQRLNDAVQFCKVPVIAVLHGAVIGGHGGGIGLDRPFLNAREIESLAQSVQQPPHLLDGQQGWRAASKENRPRLEHWAAAARPSVRLGQDQIDERRHPRAVLAGDAVEIAVMALVKAERHVDIQRLNTTSRQIAGPQVRWGG